MILDIVDLQSAQRSLFCRCRLPGAKVLELEKRTPLAFAIALKDGRTLETVGDAADYLSALNADQRDRAHWKTAIMMFNNAMREPRYLRIATMNLRSALVYDRAVNDAGA